MLAANRIFNAVDARLVPSRAIAAGERFELLPGLRVEIFPVPGTVPLYLEGETPVTDLEGGQTVGVALESAGARAFYIPGCAALTPALATRLAGAALVLFDGTLWRDDEMIRAGLGRKTGRRMGHLSIGGPEGTIAAFAGLGVGRKIFVHLNNTNPVWRPDSPERAEAAAAGWEIAHDGMEVVL